MRQRISLWLLLIVLLTATPVWAQQEKEPAAPAKEQQEEPEKVQTRITDRNISDLPNVKAKEDCVNWAWAAAVEAVLRSDGVEEYPQDYWAGKLHGNRCLESAGEPEELVKAVEGEYSLDDGRHVRIGASYTPGLPGNASDLLIPLINNRLQIVFVNGKATLFIGAQWEDITKTNGETTLTVKELRFLDLTKPEAERKSVLNVQQDDLYQVNGIFRITVELIQR